MSNLLELAYAAKENPEKLDLLIDRIRADMIAAEAKTLGKSKVLRGVKAIIKNTARRDMAGERIVDGKAYYCDGYRLVELNVPLGLPPAEADFDVKRLVYNSIDRASAPDPLTLPMPVEDLAVFLKEQKAKRASSLLELRDSCGGSKLVNGRYLQEMLWIFGEGCLIRHNPTDTTSALIFESEVGRGILLPIRPNKERK